MLAVCTGCKFKGPVDVKTALHRLRHIGSYGTRGLVRRQYRNYIRNTELNRVAAGASVTQPRATGSDRHRPARLGCAFQVFKFYLQSEVSTLSLYLGGWCVPCGNVPRNAAARKQQCRYCSEGASVSAMIWRTRLELFVFSLV